MRTGKMVLFGMRTLLVNEMLFLYIPVAFVVNAAVYFCNW